MDAKQLVGVWLVLFTGISRHGITSHAIHKSQRDAFVEPPIHRHVTNGELGLTIETNGYYSVSLLGSQWLQSGPTFFTIDGKRYSNDPQFGQHFTMDMPDPVIGKDKLGGYTEHLIDYNAFDYSSNASVNVGVGFKQYNNLNLIVFEQIYEEGLDGISVEDANKVSSGFPSFRVQDTPTGSDLGYLVYAGIMIGDTNKKIGRWNNQTSSIPDGLDGGPVILFDGTDNVIIIAPFNEFMAASSEFMATPSGKMMHWGVMGKAYGVPSDYRMQFALFYSSGGINKAMEEWGIIMRKYYNKDQSARHSDITVNYLGYYTDEGAYYCFNTIKGKNYEDTIIAVKEYADKMKIPYRYWQMDWWWFQRGPKGGILQWEPKPDVFPNGLQYLYNKTRWPVVGYTMWWSSKTPYAKTNGGKFDFMVEDVRSIPVDENFWNWLFEYGKTWGVVTYEQDFLNVEYSTMESTMIDVQLGRKWLRQMGDAARSHGLAIQYCMAQTREALQSLEISQVTHARASGDYRPNNDNWKIGISSIFAEALGIAPFKDNFWTTTDQPGNPYGQSEPRPALKAVVATLSTGPVGVSDMVNGTDVDMLMRCCNMDGLILKPDKPATAIDAQLLQLAFQDGRGPDAEVWTTYTKIQDLLFGIIFVAEPAKSWQINSKQTGFDQIKPVKVYPYNNLTNVADFSASHLLTLNTCNNQSFCLYHATPVLSFRGEELLLFGEINKWVPMSSKRIVNIAFEEDDVRISLRGAVDENVVFAYMIGGKLTTVNCKLSDAGSAVLELKWGACPFQ